MSTELLAGPSKTIAKSAVIIDRQLNAARTMVRANRGAMLNSRRCTLTYVAFVTEIMARQIKMSDPAALHMTYV
jgi:hypothetical protein